MSSSWLEELEARLERQLEAFLQANPAQETLLADQEKRDRQLRLRQEQLTLRQEAEHQRRGLLELAVEIRRWQERVQRARSAGSPELAGRAEAHVAELMDQGRRRWQELSALGERFVAVEQQLAQLQTPGRPAAADLEADWARFERDQELEALKRKLQT
ncbi:MAG: hercynine metabolism protein [Synechococcaceae cyanobacterium]|nr:hercynine metabolism protein [Synechococcaceae cyanobacterium]